MWGEAVDDGLPMLGDGVPDRPMDPGHGPVTAADLGQLVARDRTERGGRPIGHDHVERPDVIDGLAVPQRPGPAELLPIIPPRVARSEVETSGPNIRPSGLRWALS